MKLKCAFVLFLGFLVFLTYGALTTDYYHWDFTIIDWVQDSVDEDDLHGLPNALFWMGLKGVAGVVITVAAIGLWLKGWRAEAVFMALIAIPDSLNFFVRGIIGRPRPTGDLVTHIFGGPQGYSFPSGYALHVALFGGFCIYLLLRLMRPSVLRSAILVPLALYIPIAGLWLIYDGRHWPSDVLGGYMYGVFYLIILVWGYQKYVSWRRRYPEDHLLPEKLPRVARPFAWILTMIR